jgi:hypothetical protein
MAIGSRIAPELIVFGQLEDYRDRVWDGERTGSVAMIHTAGGPLDVTFRKEDDDKRPAPGTTVAVVTSAYDGQRGSSLTFVRHLMPADLDTIRAEAFHQKQAA